MAREEVKARALVLRSVDYGERDKILTLLVEGRGKRSAIAKGARGSKKRFSGMDLFRVLEVTYVERGPDKLAFLEEGTVTDDFRQIEASFDKVTTASYATEVVREMVRDGEGGEEIFRLLIDFYEQNAGSEEVHARLEADLQSFLLLLLRAAGFAPSLNHCFRSGQPVASARTWRFMLSGEGALHVDSRRQGDRTMETTRDVLEALEGLAFGYPLAPSDVPDPIILRHARPLVFGMIKTLLGKEPKSTQYLRMVLQ